MASLSKKPSKSLIVGILAILSNFRVPAQPYPITSYSSEKTYQSTGSGPSTQICLLSALQAPLKFDRVITLLPSQNALPF